MEARQTTIRFSPEIYARLEMASGAVGLPINSIVVFACMEWLEKHRPGDQMNAEGQRDLFTSEAREVLRLAEGAAKGMDHPFIVPEHLLIGLSEEADGLAGQVLRAKGLERQALARTIKDQLDQARQAEDGGWSAKSGLTDEAKRAIEAGVTEANRGHQHYLGTEHLLLGLLTGAQLQPVLDSFGVTGGDLRMALEDRMKGG